MIYYWLHIAYVFIGSRFFWKKIDLLANHSRERRVRVLDCEAFTYMANSKYFYYMDLIRLELLFRSTLHEQTVKKRMYPVIGSQKIIYKKPLKRWTKFKISLRLEGWDDKWVYHKQVFEQNGEVAAIGFTKIAFWKKHKLQDMRELIRNCGVENKNMTISDEVKSLFKEDAEILKNRN